MWFWKALKHKDGGIDWSLIICLNISGFHSFSPLFLGWCVLNATSTCLQDPFAAHTVINAQERLTGGAGVGLARRSCHHFGLRRWFLRFCIDAIAASFPCSSWPRGARHFVRNWAEALVWCLCLPWLEWIGWKIPRRSDNWQHDGPKTRKKTKLTTAPGQLRNWGLKLNVWNIRIHDSQSTEDEIHLGLQNVQMGWVRLLLQFYLPIIKSAVVCVALTKIALWNKQMFNFLITTCIILTCKCAHIPRCVIFARIFNLPGRHMRVCGT